MSTIHKYRGDEITDYRFGMPSRMTIQSAIDLMDQMYGFEAKEKVADNVKAWNTKVHELIQHDTNSTSGLGFIHHNTNSTTSTGLIRDTNSTNNPRWNIIMTMNAIPSALPKENNDGLTESISDSKSGHSYEHFNNRIKETTKNNFICPCGDTMECPCHDPMREGWNPNFKCAICNPSQKAINDIHLAKIFGSMPAKRGVIQLHESMVERYNTHLYSSGVLNPHSQLHTNSSPGHDYDDMPPLEYDDDEMPALEYDDHEMPGLEDPPPHHDYSSQDDYSYDYSSDDDSEVDQNTELPGCCLTITDGELQTELESNDMYEECNICFDDKVNPSQKRMFYPCRHTDMCDLCLHKLIRSIKTEKHLSCPFCRQDVLKITGQPCT